MAQDSTRIDRYVLTLGTQLSDTALRLAVDGPLPGDSSRYIDPTPTIHIATEEPYSCLLHLDVNVQIRGRRVTLEILGLSREVVCPMMVGPATMDVNLPVESGVYDLRVKGQGRSDRYTLTVTDSVIEVAPRTGRFTQFTKTSRGRAPRLTFGVYCDLPSKNGGLDTSLSWVCTEADQLLRDSLQITPIVLSPAQEEGFGPFPSQQWGPARYYSYETAGVFRRAYDLLQAFSRNRIVPARRQAQVAVLNWRHVGFNKYLCRAGQGWCEASMGYPYW
jgi:hypothetical protein